MYISPHHRSRIYLHFDQAITLYLALPFPQAFILLRLDEDVNAYIHNEHDAMPQDICDLDDVFEESVSELIEKVKNKKAILM